MQQHKNSRLRLNDKRVHEHNYAFTISLGIKIARTEQCFSRDGTMIEGRSVGATANRDCPPEEFRIYYGLSGCSVSQLPFLCNEKLINVTDNSLRSTNLL